MDIFTFFQSGLPYGIMNNKFDVYKIMKRLGYRMTIHRLIEISSESLIVEKNLNNYKVDDNNEKDFSNSDMLNFLKVIQFKVYRHIAFKHKLTKVDTFFMAIKACVLYGLLSSVLVVGFNQLWLDGDYGWFINCIPIVCKYSAFHLNV